jgi:hypothetical protein
MVLELCTISEPGSFHDAYAGRGRGPAAAAGAELDCAPERAGIPARPAAAMAPAPPAMS